MISERQTQKDNYIFIHVIEDGGKKGEREGRRKGEGRQTEGDIWEKEHH